MQAPDIALQKCPYEGHAVMYASLAGLNILAEIWVLSHKISLHDFKLHHGRLLLLPKIPNLTF